MGKIKMKSHSLKLLNVLVIIALILSSECFKSSIKLTSNSKKQALKKEKEGETQEDCIQPTFLSDAIFDTLLARLKASTPATMIKEFKQYYLKSSNGEMISPKNSIRLFTEVEYGSHLEEMLLLTRNYLWVSSQDLRNMVMRIRDLAQRSSIVVKLFPILIDHTKINLESINDQIDCGSKSEMETLRVKHPHPKDCFFGDISGNTVFVIDLSGSMMFTFKFQKEHVTRLLFLKRLFKRAINSLKHTQKFQIVTFSTNAKYIYGTEKSIYQATPANKKTFIDKVFAMRAGHGATRFTNISEALTLALKVEQSFDRIVFFTDGLPTVGERNPNKLRALLSGLNKQRVEMGYKEVPVNTNLLMLGGGESKAFRDGAKYYSKLVADVTNGELKNFDSKE